jgi:hypothetical protein
MGILVVVFGIVAIALGFWLRRRTAKDRKTRVSWPTTVGSIAASRVALEDTGGENSVSFTRFSAVYTYAPDGTQHRGNIYSDRAKNHKTLLAKYPTGATVEVFYDPAKADRSEIRDPLVLAGGWAAGLSRFGVILVPMGAIVAVIGLVLGFTN